MVSLQDSSTRLSLVCLHTTPPLDDLMIQAFRDLDHFGVARWSLYKTFTFVMAIGDYVKFLP